MLRIYNVTDQYSEQVEMWFLGFFCNFFLNSDACIQFRNNIFFTAVHVTRNVCKIISILTYLHQLHARKIWTGHDTNCQLVLIFWQCGIWAFFFSKHINQNDECFSSIFVQIIINSYKDNIISYQILYSLINVTLQRSCNNFIKLHTNMGFPFFWLKRIVLRIFFISLM